MEAAHGRREGGFWGESAGVVFATSPRHGRDLIALALEDQPPKVSFGPALLGYPRGTFVEVPNVRHRGTLYFEGDRAPGSPGPWQFVYLADVNGVHTELARSAPFIVRGPALEASLTAEGDTMAVDIPPPGRSGDSVTPPCLTVAFNSSPVHSKSDWVGISRRGATPNVAATKGCYMYVPGAPTGTVSFPAKYLPKERGEYEACYVQAETREVVARSNSFIVDVSPQGVVSARLAPRAVSSTPDRRSAKAVFYSL